MNVFAKHKIKHLSASSLNAYARSPWLWSLKYLGGFKDPGGPKAIAGTAVQKGLTAALMGQSWEFAKHAMFTQYDRDIAGEISDAIDAQRKLLEPMLRQAWRAYGGSASKELIGWQVT